MTGDIKIQERALEAALRLILAEPDKLLREEFRSMMRVATQPTAHCSLKSRALQNLLDLLKASVMVFLTFALSKQECSIHRFSY